MCEQTDSPLGAAEDQEYAAGHAVYKINDGETHWYVASSAGRALDAHTALMDPDEDATFTIERVPAGEIITLRLEDRAQAASYPFAEFIAADPEDEYSHHTVRAYAGQWAANLSNGEQICSTVF